jgi:hypothetical protein
MNKEQLLKLIALMEIYNDKYPQDKFTLQTVTRRAMYERGEKFEEVFNKVGHIRQKFELGTLQ